MKTAKQLIDRIIQEKCSVYTNDRGQGSSGPSLLTPEELSTLLENGHLDDYEIVPDTHQIIPATLTMHAHDPKDTTDWILACKIDDQRDNPHHHYLLLWEF